MKLEHFKNKTLKTHYFKDFSRTTYNSRTIQGTQGIQEPLGHPGSYLIPS